MKILLLIIGVLIVIVGAVYFLPRGEKTTEPVQQEQPLDSNLDKSTSVAPPATSQEKQPELQEETPTSQKPALTLTTPPPTQTKPAIRSTGGQAVSSGAKQIAAVGTVEKKKRASVEPSRFISSIIPSAYAQETTRLVAYIGSFILDSYVGDIFTYDLFSGIKTNIVTSGKTIVIEVTDKYSGQTTQTTVRVGFGRPAISEQTSKLAFVEYDKGPLDAYNDGMNVHLYDFAKGTSAIIDKDGWGQTRLSFSRDGKTLGYFNKTAQVVLYNVESRTRKVVPLSASPYYSSPIFSADDSNIYYVSNDLSILYELSLVNGQSRKLVALPLKSDGYNDFVVLPSISEDGTKIHYFQLKRSQSGQSYNFVISDLSGQTLQRLSIPQGGVESYYVSVERGKVYYASASDGGLFELDLASGSSKLLVSAISSIIGRGTSADEIVVLKFPSQGVAEFYSYNLSTAAQKKLFDNQ